MIGLESLKGLLNSITSKYTRNAQVMEPVFVPLDLKALDVTLGSILDNSKATVLTEKGEPSRTSLKAFRTRIISYILSTYKHKILIIGSSIVVNGKKDIPLETILGKHTPAVVYLGGMSNSQIVGVIFNKFNAAQSSLFDSFLNREMTKFLRDTLDADFKSFDAAYLFKHNKSDPLVKKVSLLSKVLNSFSRNKVKVEGVPLIANSASVLQIKATVESLLKTYNRTKAGGVETHASVHENISNFVSKMNAEIVIIQDESANADLERELFSPANTSKLEAVLKDTAVTTERSFLKKIGDRLVAVFKGEPTKTSASAKSFSNINKGKEGKVNVRNSVGSNGVYNFPEPRVSISRLQGLINASLEETIKSHMGKPGILNNQTGRFAHSAEVKTISLGRDGALTAFYSYMRYPYGTFAQGGRQQNPLSRDPTKLIGKSIRQIATEKANLELRTVVI